MNKKTLMLIFEQHRYTRCEWSNSCKPSKPQTKVLTNAKRGLAKQQVEKVRMSLKDKLQQSKGGAKKTWTSSKGEKARHNYGVRIGIYHICTFYL